MEIFFDEEKHIYTDSNGKKHLSVTQLMEKHELSPSYFGVDKEILNAKAGHGTEVHKEIEEYNHNGEIGFTKEFTNFVEYLKTNNVEVLASEMKVFDDLIAGTLDLIVSYKEKGKNPFNIIADIKTTSEVHYEAISWQLSIYKYLVEYQCGDLYQLNTDYGQCFHYDKDGELEVIDIKLKPIEEVTRLLECEKVGVKFIPASLVDISNQLQLMEQFTMALQFLEEQKAEIEAKNEAMKSQIMAAMKDRSIYKFQNDDISLAYTPAKESMTFDKDRFKEENPKLYEEYNTKPSFRKESLRITIRKKGAKKDE